MKITISTKDVIRNVLAREILKTFNVSPKIDDLSFDLRMVEYIVNGKIVKGFQRVVFYEKNNGIYLKLITFLNLNSEIFRVEGDDISLIWNVKHLDDRITLEINSDAVKDLNAVIQKYSDEFYSEVSDAIYRHLHQEEFEKILKEKNDSKNNKSNSDKENDGFIEVKKAITEYLLENGFNFKKKNGKDIDRLSKMEMIGGRLYDIHVRFSQNEVRKTYSCKIENSERTSKLTANLGIFQTKLKNGQTVVNHEQIKMFMSILE